MFKALINALSEIKALSFPGDVTYFRTLILTFFCISKVFYKKIRREIKQNLYPKHTVRIQPIGKRSFIISLNLDGEKHAFVVDRSGLPLPEIHVNKANTDITEKFMPFITANYRLKRRGIKPLELGEELVAFSSENGVSSVRCDEDFEEKLNQFTKK